MCFGKSLKGDAAGDATLGGDNTNARVVTAKKTDDRAASASMYSPPPGPPPGHQPAASAASYAPPPGPPPSKTQPGSKDPSPAYHDWTVVPDTSQLPPPPSLGHEFSPTSNAPYSEATRATAWCQKNALAPPRSLTPAQLDAVRTGAVDLVKPAEYVGDLSALGPGTWRGRTSAGCKDACLITGLPLYAAASASPASTKAPTMVYYEVRVKSLGRRFSSDEASVALGFVARPYPTYRLPGWQRGSLGVHSDDGRRFVNDMFGGKDFVAPFGAGETLGIGLTYSLPDKPPEYGAADAAALPKLKGEVFFTRGGKNVGGWALDEERDAAKDLGVEGLEGLHDLHGAVGVYGNTEFEVFFSPKDWLWRP
ncbi:MAG: hypothetical protein M1832_003800 [Thelocarpon impressellum]|nr:MAG: hypothetical protein M1832_003800 [Thelocarpon impressellum]